MDDGPFLFEPRYVRHHEEVEPGGSGGRGNSRWLPLPACVAVTAPRFLLDSADSIQRMSLPWAVAMTGWWCLPLLWMLGTARSKRLARVGGGAYVIFAALILTAIYRDTHSTAGFGILFVPAYLGGGIAVLLWIEALVVRRHRPDN